MKTIIIHTPDFVEMARELQLRLSALENAHHALVWKVAGATKWEPQGCDDQPTGTAESFCQNCRTCHHPLSGCPGDLGPVGSTPTTAKSSQNVIFDLR